MAPLQPAVVGLGELLWDLLPAGARIGGAPTNFACHANQLGASTAIVSCVGHDDRGDRALEELRGQGVATHGVARDNRPTGTVEVTLDAFGQPSYQITQDIAWDCLPWSAAIEQLAESADGVCFGTLAQRSESTRRTIQKFLAAMPRGALRIFDINLRAPFYDDDVILQSLELANVLKLNDEELPIVASICGLSGSETDLMQQLATRFELQVIALTCGSRGSTLLRGTEVSQQSAIPTEVVDTVGAGDAYTAALALGLLTGRDLSTINSSASQIAAFVCSQSGAIPLLPPELAKHFH